ncbi:MAG: PhoH family protein, partial [Comamonas sp.]
MPLPPAPPKRAALLAPEAYDAPARSKTTAASGARSARKPAAQDRPGGSQIDRDNRGSAPPAAAPLDAALGVIEAARQPAPA